MLKIHTGIKCKENKCIMLLRISLLLRIEDFSYQYGANSELYKYTQANPYSFPIDIFPSLMSTFRVFQMMVVFVLNLLYTLSLPCLPPLTSTLRLSFYHSCRKYIFFHFSVMTISHQPLWFIISPLVFSISIMCFIVLFFIFRARPPNRFLLITSSFRGTNLQCRVRLQVDSVRANKHQTFSSRSRIRTQETQCGKPTRYPGYTTATPKIYRFRSLF